MSLDGINESNLEQSLDEDTVGIPPMDDPATAIWNLPVSDADLEKLKAGVESKQMEDKWNVRTQVTDTPNNRLIHISRSWTGIEHCILHITIGTGRNESRIHSITWAQNKGEIRISEEQAKIDAIILCRGLLGSFFLDVPQLDESLMWNHPAAFFNPESYLRQFFKR
ncbi:Hypothetical protein D9617_9g026080 [Elsinoe fawcettii]|nr:Hypothetical protein D9617_9g026080 [Elsinoe fawcettii]